ncbi:DUF2398 family protein [Prauserella flavalba]|uniref:TIGR02678 family protein n=1 Tax=Prauserella flavalba TaxID=1477506 RepID=A0A318LJ95_9PSEU|nr:DUF2398 family protein [Prauserella flavalba]PXY23936.1 hypothetical protein BA062_27065 [Prauserella flavalba]
MTSQAAAERQRAFVGLLRHPVLDRRRHPDLWPLVRRHRVVLAEWLTTRLDYRLFLTDTTARVYRLPLDDTVVAPNRHRPMTRRVIVLAILAAAAAEDAEDITTTHDLAQRVQALSNHPDVELEPYDNDRFAHRLLFVKAVQLLAEAGTLRPTSSTSQEQGEGWAHRRDSIGGAFEVQRELLLRMVDPRALRAAVDPRPGMGELPEAAARFGLLRRLLELPVCLYEDLNDAERLYLTGQRSRVLAWCTEMTGWVAEQRAEGIALVAQDERQTDLPFPQLRATDFATLITVDILLREHGAGTEVSADAVSAAAAEFRARYPKALTKELKEPGAVRDRAERLLAALDLIRPTGRGGWRIMPAAARFRDPKIEAVAQKLTDEDGG